MKKQQNIILKKKMLILNSLFIFFVLNKDLYLNSKLAVYSIIKKAIKYKLTKQLQIYKKKLTIVERTK